ncbi:MAG TPA: hypothetical protein VFH27_09100, partial [Longimicrobiaceae bacterium]|nr:hypothetical protein [Longimicrobiaceae bacterium]
MLIRRPDDIPSSEITPERLYLDRRGFLRSLGLTAAVAAVTPAAALAACESRADAAHGGGSADDKPTPYADITSYNNFYEFGTGKDEPAQNAPRTLRVRPWTVTIDGLVKRPAPYAF